MRYFIQLSYFGKNFHGWQIQPNASTVQETLNLALSTIFEEEVYCVGAGRTDTGVHAKEMWAHVDVQKNLPQNAIHRLNRFLGKDITIQKIIAVADEAHARFDAIARSYEYHIIEAKNPFLKEQAWLVERSFDLEKMQRAADILLQVEDFSSFSKSNTQTFTNLCTITRAEFERKEDRIVFHISANRFLRNMVRAIVGTLVEVGLGKRKVEEMRTIIESKDRSLAGESAPAHGLFLTRVEYPKEIFNG